MLTAREPLSSPLISVSDRAGINQTDRLSALRLLAALIGPIIGQLIFVPERSGNMTEARRSAHYRMPGEHTVNLSVPICALALLLPVCVIRVYLQQTER